MKLYLASGTQLKHVRSEADLLELSPFFGREINAPDGDDHRLLEARRDRTNPGRE